MGSTRSTRNTLRATAGGEIAVTSVGTYFPAAVIPMKFTQTLGAFGMFLYQKDCTKKDKALLLFQSLLAATQLVLASILYFSSRTCDSNNEESICVASFYLMLVYHGTLLTGWGMSEFIRKPFGGDSEGGRTQSQDDTLAPSFGSGITIPSTPREPRSSPVDDNQGQVFPQHHIRIPNAHPDIALSPLASSEERRQSNEPFAPSA